MHWLVAFPLSGPATEVLGPDTLMALGSSSPELEGSCKNFVRTPSPAWAQFSSPPLLLALLFPQSLSLPSAHLPVFSAQQVDKQMAAEEEGKLAFLLTLL